MSSNWVFIVWHKCGYPVLFGLTEKDAVTPGFPIFALTGSLGGAEQELYCWITLTLRRRSPRFTAGVRRLVGQPLLLQPLLPTHFGKCCLLSGHNSLFYLAYLVLPSSVPELEAHAASYSFIYYNYAFRESGISPRVKEIKRDILTRMTLFGYVLFVVHLLEM